MKFRNRKLAGRALGAALGKKLPQRFDAVVPVPLHASRLQSRGFNQAEEIGRGLAGSLGALFARDVLVRVKETKMQSSLALADRHANVSGAFTPTERARAMRNARVLIVDDVVTTGATIAACAHALRSAGVTKLAAAAIAIKL